MCFSAAANFVGSGVLGTVGVVTLTRVKHRRELLFASLPTLFAIHQFTEGFVWLGLDGSLSPAVTRAMAAAFMLSLRAFCRSSSRSACGCSNLLPSAASECCPSS